jgi:predicted nucleic acid-binding protein
MNLVDSSCWLEYFAGSSAGKAFQHVIADVANLLVPTIIILEVSRRILQQGTEEDVKRGLPQMNRGAVVDLDTALAVEAAWLGKKHHLPLADSIILATAQQCGATLWTQDAHFANIPGVKYFPKNKPA